MEDVIDYEDLADDISLETGGIPEHIVLQVIPRAVQEFCSDSQILQDTVGGPAQQGRFAIGSTDELEPVAVTAVRYGDVLAKADTLTGAFTQQSAVRGIRYTLQKLKMDTGSKLVITFTGINYASDADVVRAIVVYAPSRDASECPAPRDSGLFLRAISSLVMAKLYVMPNRPWTDLGQSQYHYMTYGELLTQAKRQSKNNDLPIIRECKFSW